MYRALFFMLCLFTAAPAFSDIDRLNIGQYPSTYLNDCQGIAYIYRVNKTLNLGLRAVKNCARVEIDGKTYRMERYPLGFRFEKKISSRSELLVSVFSKKRRSVDQFIIESHRRRDRVGGDRPGGRDDHPNAGSTERSLEALQICSRHFGSSRVKSFCHETMQESAFEIEPLIKHCAQSFSSSDQKECLRKSTQFSYPPLATMKECRRVFSFASDSERCVDAALKYRRPPLDIIENCTQVSFSASERLRCIDRFSEYRHPEKHIRLLSKCRNAFTSSRVEQCYDHLKKIRGRHDAVLKSCSNGFFTADDRLDCLAFSANVPGTIDKVINQCAKSHSQASERLSCIKRFAK